MKSIVNAKKKNSRRYGHNLWGDANSPIVKRNYAPVIMVKEEKRLLTMVSNYMLNKD